MTTRSIQTICELLLSALLVLAFYCFVLGEEPQFWEKTGAGLADSETTCLVIHPQNPSVVFAGTTRAVYKSTNGGMDFARVFDVPGNAPRVNYLYIKDERAGIIYAATDSGLFASQDNGERFEQIYLSSDAKKRRCFWVLNDSGTVYVATLAGAFYRQAGDMVWRNMDGVLGERAIFSLAADDDNIYFATEDKIFRLGKEVGEVEQVFSVVGQEADVEEVIENGDNDSGYQSQIKALVVDEQDDNVIYAATSRGVFYSADEGRNWKKIADNGVPLSFANALAVSDGVVYLATSKGVFCHSQDKWQEIYQGLETKKVIFLAKDKNEMIYAAVPGGIFLLTSRNAATVVGIENVQAVKEHFRNEPSIREAQKMAISYAEVNPEKISGWRKAAAKKAWLPDLGIGLGGDKNKTLGDSVYGSYANGGQSYVGPKDKTFYDNFGWTASLSWDLGDLIWSSDQTSIDSRSKMMVELREDIVDQVTRLYFERRRLQIELLSQSSATSVTLEKEMRVAELTALIDGFTGGEFSGEIRNDK